MRSEHKCVWLLNCDSSIITWLQRSDTAPVVWSCQLWRVGPSACSKPIIDVEVADISGHALAQHNARSRMPRSHQRRRNRRRFRRSKVGYGGWGRGPAIKKHTSSHLARQLPTLRSSFRVGGGGVRGGERGKRASQRAGKCQRGSSGQTGDRADKGPCGRGGEWAWRCAGRWERASGSVGMRASGRANKRVGS